ncbi:MAG: RNA pseudouridine synthase [Flavobacteriales bacterium]|nr:RNA pseudouridine synthase [Flavobacteriales bacterium]
MKRFQFREAILHEDNHLIVLDKPAGISSLDERWNDSPSIQRFAEDYFADAQLCHRLDKDTSGLLLIAKDPDTYRDISILFEQRQIHKIYWAVADGRHYFEELNIDLPLSVTARGKAKVDKQKGKEASTRFKVLESFRHFALIECEPFTGRLHQIRIHLSSANAPISMDTVYGGKEPMLAEIKKNFNYSKWRNPNPMIMRMALHAKSLNFELNGVKHSYEAPLPKDFDVFLKLLRKYDAIS